LPVNRRVFNISGEEELLKPGNDASLFTDRGSVTERKGFDQMEVALSIGIQKMVRSDKAGSGVMFSIDTETGFPDVVIINAAWGLGENVVQGAVIPDEYSVFKPLLDKPKMRPIIEKNLGVKEKKMIYASGGTKSTKNIDTPDWQQRLFVLNDAEILNLARWANISKNISETDGYGMGKGRREPRIIHRSGKTGDGSIPGSQLFLEILRPERNGRKAAYRPGYRRSYCGGRSLGY
jgi:phosphoenolpyruvate synthase/pyruvate phosphate dikinase